MVKEMMRMLLVFDRPSVTWRTFFFPFELGAANLTVYPRAEMPKASKHIKMRGETVGTANHGG